MNILVITLLAVAFFYATIFGAFNFRMQAVTLWAGKKIVPEEGMGEYLPRGFQDAITPNWYTNASIVLIITRLILLVLGTFYIWYLGIALFILSFILLVIIKERLFPDGISFYLKMLIHSMANREADYRKSGDIMRADVAKDMLSSLSVLYINTEDLKTKIPSYSEIKNMKISN